MTLLAYHFTGEKLRDGRDVPQAGEWLEHEGHCVLCRSGLHASRHVFDALMYAPGATLHLVECDEVVDEQHDKLVCRRRKIIQSIDATGLLNEYARWIALQVIDLWDAPEVVLEYLETGDESLQGDALSAARPPECSAAWSAAWSAADAAEAAVAAAADAEWSSAWSVARSAARYAARSAARYAARSAAEAAARSSAWSAARQLQRDKLRQMVDKAFGKDSE